MTTIANYITITRLFLVFTLLIVRPLSVEFFLIYTVCGISDMLDGYVARKTDTTSRIGEKLDSVADLLMIFIVIYILYPIIQIPVKFYYWIIVIVVIRVVSMIVVFAKHKTFGILHTYGNKVTGFLLFLSPLLLVRIQLDVLTYILCLFGSASAIEELIIHLISKELELNKKSIFIMK
ncbi:CDP-alcohol phosphatidyltransferase family protein [Maledivibacter halophilus]|uniref:Phosphatidylglycerophosphate synthase n=1 Tax=Maledivibacter halophilus TaxID=36842 RepID=A0A1T5L129_9FIRM|nr:CDP-alcohol phosphatidyltransferase family protein [Maledivibacter halophilus]SKC69098.1 CDP-diacylglycerol--glycerol-3-phosphate 3-phosphatidyltransferase [Maledivibacter halophilus]